MKLQARNTSVPETVPGERQVWLDHQLFSDMFRDSPVSMAILKGPDFILHKTNAVFDRVIPHENILGRPCRDALPELKAQGFIDMMEEVYTTGRAIRHVEMPVCFETADGPTELYFDFMYQPFRDGNGQIAGIFYSGVDVTEKVLTRRRVEESERRYRQIVETAQEGIWLLGKDHETLFVNRKMCDILGFQSSEMAGQNIVRFIDTSDEGSVEKIGRSGTGSSVSSFELRLLSKEGRRVWTSLHTTTILDDAGRYNGLLAMVTDITERKAADEELRKLSLIARSTTNSIIITNSSQRIEWVNEAFTRITGYSFEEVKGRTTSMLLGAETDTAVETYINEKIANSEQFSCEILKYKKSGVPFWVEIQGRPVFDQSGKLSYYFKLESDITERKRAYEQLLKNESQIRTFARQLNNMLEDERSRIAREIHDEFGQHLMGLKMSLSYLEKLSGLPGEAAKVIRQLLSGLESTFESLKSFATELRPGILDTLGLVPSIEWLVQSFESKSGICCNVEINVRQQIFEKDVSNTYFRICQEALTNILKHAEATQVKIQITQQIGTLCLEIADNGKGMVSEKMENPFSLGLLGMQERARLIGGELHIVSKPEEGTRIKLTTQIHGSQADLNSG